MTRVRREGGPVQTKWWAGAFAVLIVTLGLYSAFRSFPEPYASGPPASAAVASPGPRARETDRRPDARGHHDTRNGRGCEGAVPMGVVFRKWVVF